MSRQDVFNIDENSGLANAIRRRRSLIKSALVFFVCAGFSRAGSLFSLSLSPISFPISASSSVSVVSLTSDLSASSRSQRSLSMELFIRAIFSRRRRSARFFDGRSPSALFPPPGENFFMSVLNPRRARPPGRRLGRSRTPKHPYPGGGGVSEDGRE